MASQNPLALSRDNIPDTECRVAAPRNDCAISRRQSANCMVMALEMKLVVRVLVDIRLKMQAGC